VYRICADRPTAEVCDGELISSLRTFIMRTPFVVGIAAIVASRVVTSRSTWGVAKAFDA
jgi:hypothetical protein